MATEPERLSRNRSGTRTRAYSIRKYAAIAPARPLSDLLSLPLRPSPANLPFLGTASNPARSF